MIRHLVSTAAFALASAAALAAPITFDFKDPKGVNNVRFDLDAPLESMSGNANGVTGTVVFDPANPAALTGKIVVAANSLKLPNATMQDHLHSPNWIDVAKYPEITFEVTKVANAKTTGTDTTADVTGNITIKGVTKEITVPAKISYMADAMGRRQPNAKGDILVVRSEFSIKRDDFGIQAGQRGDTVGADIKLSLALAGFAPKA
ncbi:MAG TPA: YceI family protein [Opitutaceae bacterium]